MIIFQIFILTQSHFYQQFSSVLSQSPMLTQPSSHWGLKLARLVEPTCDTMSPPHTWASATEEQVTTASHLLVKQVPGAAGLGEDGHRCQPCACDLRPRGVCGRRTACPSTT